MAFYALKDVIKTTFEKKETRFNEKTSATAVPTGFNDIDQLLSGLQRSDLIVIAGGPNMGATTLCLNIAARAAIEKKIPVAVFSLDLTKEHVVQRMLSSESRVRLDKIKAGALNDEDWGRLTEAMARLYEARVYVDDTPVRRTDRMGSMMKQLKVLKRDSGIKLVIVDYLQLFIEKPGEKHFAAAESLKNIAKALNVPVIAVLRLQYFKDDDEMDYRPGLPYLRRRYFIVERYADVVMLVYRDCFFNPCKCPRKKCSCGKRNAMEVIIEKNRNGPVGSVNLFFDWEIVRLENISGK